MSGRLGRALRRAQRRSLLLTIERKHGWEKVDGVVVSVGPRWFVVAAEHDAGFAGHVILRRRDIARIRRHRPNFVVAALQAAGHWPMPGLDVDVSRGTRVLLESVGRLARPVGIYWEATAPDSIFIGLPRRPRGGSFKLRTIDPRARWASRPIRVGCRDVSRIEVDDPYTVRLRGISGDRPPGRKNARTAG